MHKFLLLFLLLFTSVLYSEIVKNFKYDKKNRVIKLFGIKDCYANIYEKYENSGKLKPIIKDFKLIGKTQEIQFKNENNCKSLVVFGKKKVTKLKKANFYSNKYGIFTGPKGLFTDNFSNLFIVDSGNDKALICDSKFYIQDIFGSFGTRSSDSFDITDGIFNFSEYSNHEISFNEPVDIVVFNDIFITDSGNKRVVKFDKYGNFLDSISFSNSKKLEIKNEIERIKKDFTLDEDEKKDQIEDVISEFDTESIFDNPQGMAIDRLADLYIADTGNDKIVKMDTLGNIILEFGSYGFDSDQLNEPLDLVISDEDDIFVLDSGNNRVSIFDRIGNFKNNFDKKTKLKKPNGIYYYEKKYIVVNDSGNNRIIFFDTLGQYIGELNLENKFKNKFSEFTGISIVKNNFVITCFGLSDIFKFKIDQNIFIKEVAIN